MDSGTTSTRPGAEEPTIPPEALEAITAPRAPDAPRRCFICLTDEEPSDPPSSWVDPCPCTLEAHQDCMLSWVVDCERSNKPLQCPVCKSQIGMEGPWDPIVNFHDAVQGKFTRASPFVLFTGVSLGVQVSAQMYGAMALWMFSGKEALMEFMLGPDMILDGRSSNGVKFTRLGNAAILMNVAPALLLGQLLPNVGNKIFVPMASLYGIYHVVNDDQFFTWPPSPQLAIAVFPYIRSIYYNLWKEFVFPYEVSLNRQILGLPPAEPRRNEADRANRRDRNAEGGVLGFLQTLLEALDPNEEEQGPINDGGQIQLVQENVPDEGQADDQEGEVVFELVIEGGPGVDDVDFVEERIAEQGQNQQAPAGGQAAPANQEGEGHLHEAPQAPPANRPGLGSILSNMSNAIVSALILPGISFAMGEALRLVLPKSWTSVPYTFWRQRPGLLQQQWGRSLVGGCLFVVMRDVIRLYAKHQKVAAMSNRRVKNVDRQRRGK